MAAPAPTQEAQSAAEFTHRELLRCERRKDKRKEEQRESRRWASLDRTA